ncbi:MAG: adenylyltransferase/cytidyltransferase family protein [Candidatus Hydrogenedentes bacterium]|nr:adenylyltransferase/cytidyltransferase family protein [Candidatus Hydrogenedentota bacterium]
MSAIPQSSKQIALEGLVDLAGHYRRQSKTIVWTNGCFEILHAGHIDFLLKASRLGDVFIVGVNSDASVAAVKGPGRPLATEAERLLVLSAVECIDYITVFDQPDCAEVLRALKPDVYAKGLHHLHGGLNERERAVIEESGGCIALIAGDLTKSTASIVERIRRG